MALKVSPQEGAEKWARRLQQAQPDISTGVDRVTEAPGIKAARSEQKMLAGVTEAVTSGKWSRAVASVDLPTWQRMMKEKGIPRIAEGVRQAQGKMADINTRLYAAIETVQSQVNGMPDITLEDRIQRSAAFQRGMASQQIK